MYIPSLFACTDQRVLHDLMEQFSFATLVTATEGITASHLPFLLDRERGQHGTLVAHMARANTQWHAFDGSSEALIIFQGEHGYITPSWYEHHPSVPTWNYAVVHAYGAPRVVDDPARVRHLLERLVTQHESERPDPWAMELPEDYLAGMQRGIVMFEIPIRRLEGKLKLSQNRPADDQQRVVAALAASPDPSQQSLATRMAETLGSPPAPAE